MNCRYVARPSAMIGARSTRYIVAFFLAAELASSLPADSRAANSQTSNLRRNPHILTRHRSTAKLRVVGIETSRTESLIEEPTPELNDLSMPRLRIREIIISSCVDLAPASLKVCTHISHTCMWFCRLGLSQRKRNCCTWYTVLLF